MTQTALPEIEAELPVVARWNEPIPLTAPDGRVLAYACPQCLHVSANISGGTVEFRAEESLHGASRCCCCQECGARIGRRWSLRCADCEAKQRRETDAMRPVWEAQAQARANALAQSLVSCLNLDAATLLLRLMEDISEEYYCAGWMGGLEYDLWAMVNGGLREYGMGTVSETEVGELKRLSEAAGGWWKWHDQFEALFTPLNEWLAECESKGKAQ